MKNVVRFFCIIIIGIAVFLGALLIAEGVRQNPRGAQPAEEQAAISEASAPEGDINPVSREKIFRSIEQSSEGSAL